MSVSKAPMAALWLAAAMPGDVRASGEPDAVAGQRASPGPSEASTDDELILIVDEEGAESDVLILGDADEPSAAPESWLGGTARLDYGVATRLAVDTRFDPTQEDVLEWWNQAYLGLDYRRDQSLRAVARVRLRFGVVGERPREGRPLWLVNAADPKWAADVDVRDAWLEYRLGDFRVRAGMQIFTWGKNELLAPADQLNPIDLRYDALALLTSPKDAKLAVLALNLTYLLGDLAIDLVIQPLFRRSPVLLFGRDFAVGPPGSRLEQQAKSVLALHPSIQDAAQTAVAGTEVPNTPGATSVALRVTGRLLGLDLGATAHFTWDPVPMVWADPSLRVLVANSDRILADPQVLLQDDTLRAAATELQQKIVVGQEVLSARYRRMWMFALEGQGVVGDVVIKGDLGYSPARVFYTPQNTFVTRPYWSAVLGAEYTYGERLLAGITGFGQFALDAPRQQRLVGLEGDTTNPAERAVAALYGVAATARYVFAELGLTATATGLYTLAPGDLLVTGEVSYKVLEPHVVALGGLYLWGPQGTLGDTYKRNDLVYLRYEAAW